MYMGYDGQNFYSTSNDWAKYVYMVHMYWITYHIEEWSTECM